MAKSTSENSKTTKTETAKKAAAKKTATAKKAADPKGATATPKASKAGRAGTDPAGTLVKKCEEAASKFEKIGDAKYNDIKEKLEWCIGSYKHDKNPSGLVEYGRKAADSLKEARAKKPRQVSQKLIDDLEKAVAKI